MGDIVLVQDNSSTKGKYIMAVVEAMSVGKDGLMRSCKVGYGFPEK